MKAALPLEERRILSIKLEREFSPLLWVILALLDPDPNADPDPADQNESGSITLVSTQLTTRTRSGASSTQ